MYTGVAAAAADEEDEGDAPAAAVIFLREDGFLGVVLVELLVAAFCLFCGFCDDLF